MPKSDELSDRLSKILFGQDAAIETIVPYVQMQQAGLAPDGRPVGVFLLLGPTGTGKTHTVEALAQVLHGSSKMVLRIDCGEFQMEHEVAKLIGAPPGYLGHRETCPLLSQAKINCVSSDTSAISLVLFDEVEKSAPSMMRLLLGILDKATLRLGDNSSVNFENTMIFMTSNIGAKEMQRAISPEFGFEAVASSREQGTSEQDLSKITANSVRKKFSPEFINRIDATVTYNALRNEDYVDILNRLMSELQSLICARLGARSFIVRYTPAARISLLDESVNDKYGARELKRALHRRFVQPLAADVSAGKVMPGCTARLNVRGGRFVIEYADQSLVA